MDSPDYLYHYTTAEGLIGIVKNQEIWATNILYLNDVKEFRHGVELGQKYVNELLEQAHDPGEKAYLENLASAVEEMRTAGEAPGFVCSFSEWEDDLSQWRAYCPGGGFAIGFDRGLLREVALDHLYEFRQCSYDPPAQENAISKFIDVGINEDKDKGDWPRRCPRATVRLAIASAALKNPAFSSEREWRMVRYPGPDSERKDTDFRTKSGVLVPYMKCSLTFKTDLARTKSLWESVRVTVGPTPNPEVSKASVERLLRLHSPAERVGAVTITTVPYKFW